MISSIVTFLIILSVLVLVHECGHFFAARRAGIWVEEFGFGLPPRIAGKKIGETLYSINLLPFGGFVKLHGENSSDSITKPNRAFLNQSKKVRASIVTAGVAMNFILAIVVFAISYSFTGVPRNSGYVRIVEVRQGSPAESSGLVAGDIVKKVQNKSVKFNGEFVGEVEANKGKEITLLVGREDVSEPFEVLVVPRENPPEGEGALGVTITDQEMYLPPIWQRPFLGIFYGTREAIFWGETVLNGFVKIIAELFRGILPSDVAGPAGLFVITSEVAKVGILPLLNWLGIISVNLAILNIFPLPALDGGRLLFIGIEKLFGRRVLPKVENWLHAVSLGVLVLFLLAITFREVRMIYSLGFSGYIDFLSSGQGLQ